MRQLIIVALLVLYLVACSSQTAEQLESLEAQANNISQLEARLAALEEASQQGQEQETRPLDIAVAQYVMDTAGFHGMAEGLNETQVVDPGYLGATRRVDKILSNTPWSAELEAEAGNFLDLLHEFETALEADDGETAAGLATEVHEVGHDFSQSIDGWLGAGEDDHQE